MADNEELWFTALGPSGAGKTTLLACMHRNFEELLPGSFYPSDPKTFSTLGRAYKKLEEEANGPSLEFGVGVEGTEDLRQYAFTIKGRKSSLPVRFFDFPGGWMDPYNEAQEENYNDVITIVQRSMVLLVAINTPYLMEANGRYKDHASIDEIEHIIKMSLQKDDSNKLIILVPIKCERYTRTSEEAQKMRGKIKETFDNTLRLPQNPVYRGRLAIALLPVHTVGNAQFSRFVLDEGRVTREVYLKNREMRFSPKDADQPLRFAMSFFLNEFEKGRNTFLNRIFSQNDLKEVGDFIRKDMKTDNDDFEIFCGRELIAEPSSSEEGDIMESSSMPEELYETMKEIISPHANIEIWHEEDVSNDTDSSEYKDKGEKSKKGLGGFWRLAMISFFSFLVILWVTLYLGSQLEQIRLGH